MGNRLTTIEEFYELVKEDFHGDFRDLDGIVRGPFRHLKKELTEGTLKPYRFQYFGTFFIPRPRVFYAKKNLTEKYSQGLVSEEKFTKRMETLLKYVEEDHC